MTAWENLYNMWKCLKRVQNLLKIVHHVNFVMVQVHRYFENIYKRIVFFLKTDKDRNFEIACFKFAKWLRSYFHFERADIVFIKKMR